MAKGNAKKLAIGAALGAAIGFAAGILTAPKSGKETRSDIKKGASKFIRDGEKQLKVICSDLNRLVASAKKQMQRQGFKARVGLKPALARAEKTKQKVREVISAIHSGEADSADLKKAVADGKAALSSLKRYIKT